jgi:hypothetical protein
MLPTAQKKSYPALSLSLPHQEKFGMKQHCFMFASNSPPQKLKKIPKNKNVSTPALGKGIEFNSA